MKSIRFKDEYELRFYRCDQGLHLMVWQNGSALRCRKERVASVRSLIDRAVDTLGKTGLQLRRKSGKNIQIFIKKVQIGTITQDVLENTLEALSSGKLKRYEAGP